MSEIHKFGTSTITRTLVVGPIGAGKSFAAQRLSVALRKPLVQLDRLMLDKNQIPKPRKQFVEEAEEFFEREEYQNGWVVDGTYRSLRHLTWDQADVIGYIRPSLPRNIALLALRGYTHDTTGGNSDQPVSDQLRRLMNNRKYDLEKLDTTTREYAEMGKYVVKAASAPKLVSAILDI